MKSLFIISAVILSCSCILMCISLSTSHWIDTEMNFRTSTIFISKAYRGLFQICQDMTSRGKYQTKCKRYKEFTIAQPAYWKAVQGLLIMNILGSFSATIVSILLAFYFKSKSVIHLFLLSFYQVLPVCFGLVALAMFTSKNVEETEQISKSAIIVSSSFGYSFIAGWCSNVFGFIALISGFIFTLLSYRNERSQMIARFEKLESQ